MEQGVTEGKEGEWRRRMRGVEGDVVQDPSITPLAPQPLLLPPQKIPQNTTMPMIVLDLSIPPWDLSGKEVLTTDYV